MENSKNLLFRDESIMDAFVNKRYRKPKGQSRMDNPDTGNIGHTRHRTNTSETQNHNTIQKTKKMSTTDLTENLGVASSCLLYMILY